MNKHSLSFILPCLKQAKSQGHTLILVTGVFDILHQEHINFLTKAKQVGDILIIGVESDARVKKIKGPNRPVNSQTERARNLHQLHLADYIFILPRQFCSPADHQKLIATIKPDILAVSSHTSFIPNKQKILQKHGGQVKIIHQHNPNFSTTKILNSRHNPRH